MPRVTIHGIRCHSFGLVRYLCSQTETFKAVFLGFGLGLRLNSQKVDASQRFGHCRKLMGKHYEVRHPYHLYYGLGLRDIV